MAEKMITMPKRFAVFPQSSGVCHKEDVVKKLFDEMPEFANQRRIYRIVKTGPRRGDAAEMCIIELAVPETANPPRKKAEGPKPPKAQGRETRGEKGPAKAAKPAEE